MQETKVSCLIIPEMLCKQKHCGQKHQLPLVKWENQVTDGVPFLGKTVVSLKIQISLKNNNFNFIFIIMIR